MAGFVQAMHANRAKKRRGGALRHNPKRGKRATQEAADDGKRLIRAIGPTGHTKRMSITVDG